MSPCGALTQILYTWSVETFNHNQVNIPLPNWDCPITFLSLTIFLPPQYFDTTGSRFGCVRIPWTLKGLLLFSSLFYSEDSHNESARISALMDQKKFLRDLGLKFILIQISYIFDLDIYCKNVLNQIMMEYSVFFWTENSLVSFQMVSRFWMRLGRLKGVLAVLWLLKKIVTAVHFKVSGTLMEYDCKNSQF